MTTNIDQVPVKERLQAANTFIERQKGLQTVNNNLTTTLNQLSEGCVCARAPKVESGCGATLRRKVGFLAGVVKTGKVGKSRRNLCLVIFLGFSLMVFLPQLVTASTQQYLLTVKTGGLTTESIRAYTPVYVAGSGTTDDYGVAGILNDGEYILDGKLYSEVWRKWFDAAPSDTGSIGVDPVIPVYTHPDPGDNYFFTHWSDGSLQNPHPSLALTGPITLTAYYVNKIVRLFDTYDSTGVQRDVFSVGESVWVADPNPYAGVGTFDLYIVQHIDWSYGMKIPSRVPGTATKISTEYMGNIPMTLVWDPPLTPGRYDVVVDEDGDGYYTHGIDRLDSTVVSVEGFFVIPELPLGTILGLVGCFAALGVYRLSKRDSSGLR